ncbi:anti-sigma factor family protein [Novipirellula rosea]
MRCETVVEQLSAHFDGELSVSLSEDIDSHLTQCEACSAESRSFGRISDLVGTSTLRDLQPPPWAFVAERLQVEPTTPVTLPSDSSSAKSGRSKLRDVMVIVASLAASIIILAWTWRPAEEPTQMAHSGHSHHSGHAMNAAAINFQDTVSLQQQDIGLAMQTLAKKYEGREASLDEVVKNVGFKPIVQSPLPSGARLVSAQLLTMPQCNCVEGECMCGPGLCNCVACVCERPDGSTFLVIEQCHGQNVNFGDLPVQLVQRGDHELHVTSNEKSLAVTWTANRTRKVAFGLRDLNEMDQLLAVN